MQKAGCTWVFCLNFAFGVCSDAGHVRKICTKPNYNVNLFTSPCSWPYAVQASSSWSVLVKTPVQNGRFPVQIHVDNGQWRICVLEMTYASAAAESTGGTGTQLEYWHEVWSFSISVAFLMSMHHLSKLVCGILLPSYGEVQSWSAQPPSHWGFWGCEESTQGGVGHGGAGWKYAAQQALCHDIPVYSTAARPDFQSDFEVSRLVA